MKKDEKIKIAKAIKLLMTDDGFDDAIDILLSLIGGKRAVTEALKDPDAKTVSIFGAGKEEMSFEYKSKKGN
jgi:hypothetical protein